MTIEILLNGNLRITADGLCRRRIRKLLRFFRAATYAADAAFLADELQCRKQNRYQQTAPCSVGALTEAPLITDGKNVWGFMNYQVESFLESLAEGKETIWTKG